MPKIKVNDIQVYYEIHGRGEPLVLISGFSADHTAWRGVVEAFSKKYQVIVFDNRGAGQTDVSEGPYTIDLLAADVAELCNVLGIEKAHFVGNSMGGYIVQTLAYKHAGLVKSAVISNSPFITHTPFRFFMQAQLELKQAKAPLGSLSKAASAWVFSYQFLSQPNMLEQLIEWNINNPHPFTIKGHEAQYAAVKEFDSSDWVHHIAVPTLVIGADQDLIFSEGSIKALADKIPNSEYFGFKQCGHLPYIEYPEEFVALVTNFIKP